ncbi:nuclease-related domain-containing protein [Thermoplasmatota archaeon]
MYGLSGAERDILRECSPRVKNFVEIKPTLSDLKNKLESNRRTFFDGLPNLIDKEQNSFEELESKESEVEKEWNIKIKEIQNSINKNKWKFWKYFDLLIKERISKPKAIRNVQKEIKSQDDLLYELRSKPEEYFAREQSGTISEINQLKRVVKSPEYYGAYGEYKARKELSKLSNDFHLICNVKISFNHWIYYRGKRNLREAQMDFVVVGPTGIYIIEVKNWSNETLRNHKRFSPHEQVDRAGKLLWRHLKNHTIFYKPRITKVLVPIQHNIEYNSYYKSVLIRDVQNLSSFIEDNKRYPLSEKKVGHIVSILR